MQTDSHYDTLLVSKYASVDVVRAVYKALAQKYHPDRNGNGADSVIMMQAINAAYSTISDPQKRAEYDQSLSRQKGSPGKLTAAEAQADKAAADALSWETRAGKFLQEAHEAQQRALQAAEKIKKFTSDIDISPWRAWEEKALEDENSAKSQAAGACAKAKECRKAVILAARLAETGNATPTHYDELEIAPLAPDEVVLAAHTALIQKYAAAGVPRNADSDRVIQCVETAYRFLSDPLKKSDYDLRLQPVLKAKTSQLQASPVDSTPTKTNEPAKAAGRAAALDAATAAWLEKLAEEEQEALKKAAAARAEAVKKAKDKDATIWATWATKMEAAAKEATKRLEKAKSGEKTA